MLGVTPSDSLDYTLQTIGLNTLRSYQLAPGTVCQLNFDGIDNQQMYFLPANISTSGQNISISYDRFINLNGNCIKDYSVIGAFKGLLLNYTKMYNTKNNGFCKYYIYLSAANCSSNCNSLSYNRWSTTYINDNRFIFAPFAKLKSCSITQSLKIGLKTFWFILSPNSENESKIFLAHTFM